MKINLGKWDEESLDKLLRESSAIADIGERINFLSKLFLGIPYKEETLIGSENNSELFVINLAGVDCFTFLDYIEAMRLSGSFREFIENLKMVRYRENNITFEDRNHFFTDWRDFNANFVDDVTEKIGVFHIRRVQKNLNVKSDGTLFLPGLQGTSREISYIPAGEMNYTITGSMQTGDYAGIYSEKKGLDVSHVGIVIKEGERVFFRHASSGKEHGKVVSQELKDYLTDKPGLIILRPKAGKDNVSS
jgi:hypothetical protein